MNQQRVVTGYFTEESELFSAVKEIQEKGFSIMDVKTPFPVHGLDKLLKFKKPNLSFIAFVAGSLGLIIGLGGQFLVSTKLYSINFGGKPLTALPSFMPVAVILAFMIAVFAVVFAFLYQSKLGAGAEAWIPDEGISDDRFLIVLDNEKGEPDTLDCMKSVGAKDVKVVEVNFQK